MSCRSRRCADVTQRPQSARVLWQTSSNAQAPQPPQMQKGEVRTCEGKAASAAAGCAIRSPWRCSTLSAAIACHPACCTICCRRSSSRARSELLDFVGHEIWAGAHSSRASKAICEGAGQQAHDAAPPRACAAPIWPPRRPSSPSATVVRFPRDEFLHFRV